MMFLLKTVCRFFTFSSLSPAVPQQSLPTRVAWIFHPLSGVEASADSMTCLELFIARSHAHIGTYEDNGPLIVTKTQTDMPICTYICACIWIIISFQQSHTHMYPNRNIVLVFLMHGKKIPHCEVKKRCTFLHMHKKTTESVNINNDFHTSVCMEHQWEDIRRHLPGIYRTTSNKWGGRRERLLLWFPHPCMWIKLFPYLIFFPCTQWQRGGHFKTLTLLDLSSYWSYFGKHKTDSQNATEGLHFPQQRCHINRTLMIFRCLSLTLESFWASHLSCQLLAV